MKKLLSVVLSTTVLFAACGEDKSEEQDKGASKVASENTSEKKVQKDDNKQTQQDTTKDKQKTEKQTTEDQSNQQTTKRKYTYVDALGHVDILSDAFIKGYTRSNRTTGFAGIEQGMDLAQVGQLYGKPTNDGKSRISENHERFGDIAIENTDGKVSQIYINSYQPYTREKIIAFYGVATEVWKSAQGDRISLVYDNKKNNGFKLIIHFDKNDQFIAMEQRLEDYPMEGELIVSDDDAPSPGESVSEANQNNNEPVSCGYENNPTNRSEKEEKLHTIAIANACLDKYEENPNDNDSPLIAWNLMIRGATSGYFGDYPDVKVEAEKVYDRLEKYDPRTKDYRNEFTKPISK
ncbi:hypothetical protein ACMGE5_00365 [Macrococcus equi]|uniref:hypothetical protein n=1 Tax=Macrococcus equi TaxID=3395462 RepID=UPI0039BE36C3